MKLLTLDEFRLLKKTIPLCDWRLVPPGLVVELGPKYKPVGRADFTAEIEPNDYALDAAYSLLPQAVFFEWMSGCQLHAKVDNAKLFSILAGCIEPELADLLDLLERKGHVTDHAPRLYWCLRLLRMQAARQLRLTPAGLKKGDVPLVNEEGDGLTDRQRRRRDRNINAMLAERAEQNADIRTRAEQDARRDALTARFND